MSPFSNVRSDGPHTICETPPGPDMPGIKGTLSAPLFSTSIFNLFTAVLSVSPIANLVGKLL